MHENNYIFAVVCFKSDPIVLNKCMQNYHLWTNNTLDSMIAFTIYITTK